MSKQQCMSVWSCWYIIHDFLANMNCTRANLAKNFILQNCNFRSGASCQKNTTITTFGDIDGKSPDVNCGLGWKLVFCVLTLSCSMNGKVLVCQPTKLSFIVYYYYSKCYTISQKNQAVVSCLDRYLFSL